MSVIFGFLPASLEQCKNALLLAIGVFVGWFLNPAAWPAVGGPFRAIAIMLAQASRESGYAATASGDGGQSIGILQYNSATVDGDPLPVASGESDWRLSPFWSGFYACKYVAAAVVQQPRWILELAAPVVVSYGAWRHLWTHGVTAASYASLVADRGAVLTRATAEERVQLSFYAWRALSLVVVVVVVQLFIAAGVIRLARR